MEILKLLHPQRSFPKFSSALNAAYMNHSQHVKNKLLFSDYPAFAQSLELHTHLHTCPSFTHTPHLSLINPQCLYVHLPGSHLLPFAMTSLACLSTCVPLLNSRFNLKPHAPKRHLESLPKIRLKVNRVSPRPLILGLCVKGLFLIHSSSHLTINNLK